MIIIFVLMILSFIQSNEIEQAKASIKTSEEEIKKHNKEFDDFMKRGFHHEH